MPWTVAMYLRLVRLDGRDPDGVDATTAEGGAALLSATFPDVAVAEAALSGLEAFRRRWAPWETIVLRDLYADTPTVELAARLGRTVHQVYRRAFLLGLRKSAAYLAGPHSCRLRRGDNPGVAFCFPKGHRPFNKEMKGWQAGGRAAETMFKPGDRPHTWLPIGTERVSKDGYLQRKVSDTGHPPRDWRGVHVLAWEEANGPVPAGGVVVFRSADRRDFRPENLELVDRVELMRRNTIHRYPAELKQAIRLVGKLRKAIGDQHVDPEQD